MAIQKVEEKKPVPVIPKDLLEYLEQQFPNRAPTLDTADRYVWALAGQQLLISHLRVHFNRQNQPLKE